MRELFVNLWLRVKALTRRRQLERDLEEEMSFHLSLRQASHEEFGRRTAEAQLAAKRDFGNASGFKEACRDMWTFVSLEEFWQDMRFAARTLKKQPGFTIMAILSLGLGIGANTAVFTLVNDLLLKSLPVEDPDHLISMGKAEGGGVLGGLSGKVDIFSYSFFKGVESNKEAFREVAAYGSFPVRVSVRAAGRSTAAQQATGALVSGGFFHVLGAAPFLGRVLMPADASHSDAEAVAVLSFDYWQREFAGDVTIVGKSLVLNGTPFTIVGVMPQKFYGITLDDQPPDLWLPLTMQQQAMLRPSLIDRNGPYWLHMAGRLQPNTNLAQAQQWISLQLRRYMLDEEGPGIRADRKQDIQTVQVELQPGGRGVSYLRGAYAEPLRVLMAVVALVLLIACANLANFFLSKIASRQHEFATRLALGAGVARIVRQMLTESLTVSFLGGALGFGLAFWGTRALLHFVVEGAVRTPFNPNPDFRVLGFTFAVSLVTGLLCGLAPAWQASRLSAAAGMRANSRTVAGDARPGHLPLSKILITLQVALSLLLLVGAGLFARTLNNLDHEAYGFNRSNVLSIELDFRLAGYKSDGLNTLYQRLLEQTGSVPGVRSVSLSAMPPLVDGSWNLNVVPKGHVPQPHEDLLSSINSMTPQYFETAGIPLIAGRLFSASDGPTSAKVLIVNQMLAKRLFPHGDAIGKFVTVMDDKPWQIVGIVKDGKYRNAREKQQPMTFLPIEQLTGEDLFASELMVRTSRDPLLVAGELRQALAQVDSNIPIRKISTLEERVDHSMAREQMVSRLAGFFSMLALMLACIGLYGVMSYNVVRRSNEIGIRMALGAKANEVLWMVLRETVTLLVIGIAIGVPVTLVATRYIASQLFGLSPYDPVTLLIACVAIAAVTIAAGYLPARRATKVDPLIALRYE